MTELDETRARMAEEAQRREEMTWRDEAVDEPIEWDYGDNSEEDDE
jgi:hypothetical protein